MQPAARYAAAIEILDDILSGTPAEKALTSWARNHRFAGSKDRAALRDHVFDALRRKRSAALLGGGETGRGLILGLCRLQGQDLGSIFSGSGHAPAPLEEGEATLANEPLDQTLAEAPPAIRLDCQDWIYAHLHAQLGPETEPFLKAQATRAPVFLRVNALKATREQAIAVLAETGIEVAAVENFKNSLKVTKNERKIKNSKAFLEGFVELQDLSSQAAVAALDLPRDARILDYCAGGGGKTLALAAHPTRPAALFAHDVAPARLRDLPNRAARAEAQITVLKPDQIAGKAPFDLVFVDAPCSGSGTWRRTPDAKWRLQTADLARYIALQHDILKEAAAHVAPGGQLIYATCSVFEDENEAQVARFLKTRPDWVCQTQWRADFRTGGDGFYSATLKHAV